MLKRIREYFSVFEICLWLFSVTLILVSFFAFENDGCFTLFASLLGVTALIFCAKGNPIGQMLMVVFSLFYSIISLSFSYYGELVTYAGMTLPMAVFSLFSWIRNPHSKGKSEVRVNKVSKNDLTLLFSLALIITAVFYFVLGFFNTANLIISTLSVTTSFIAAFLTYKRSPFFALAYAINDIVLITMWVYASLTSTGYVSVVVCFFVFLMNDTYSFINWMRMQKRQKIKKQELSDC